MKDRESIRLKEYNYSKSGFYYITINVQDKICLFGKIRESKMILNKAGFMIERLYNNLTNRFSNIKLHEYIIMPNHMHCIIEITDPMSVGATLVVAHNSTTTAHDNKMDIHNNKTYAHNKTTPNNPILSKNTSVTFDSKQTGMKHTITKRATTRVAPTKYGYTIGNIIGAFKSLTTIEYIKMVKNKVVLPFDGKLWQRGFHDHIIRNQKDFDRIREYIINNPLNWKKDINFIM